MPCSAFSPPIQDIRPLRKVLRKKLAKTSASSRQKEHRKKPRMTVLCTIQSQTSRTRRRTKMFSRVQILHQQPLQMPKTTFPRFKTRPEINLKHLEPVKISRPPPSTEGWRARLRARVARSWAHLIPLDYQSQTGGIKCLNAEPTKTGRVFPAKKNMNIGRTWNGTALKRTASVYANGGLRKLDS